MFAKGKVTAKRLENNRGNSLSQKKRNVSSQHINPLVDQMLILNRTLGNKYFQRLFEAGAIETKINIGKQDDKYEREADLVADQVMRMPDPGIQDASVLQGIASSVLEEKKEDEMDLFKPVAGEITTLVQRQAQEEEATAPLPFRALNIIRQGGIGATFVSTDSITLNAQVLGMPADQVNWTVHSMSADSGNGNPHAGTNQSRFTFTPNPVNRPTTGSRVPNDPIIYRVEARAQDLTANFSLVHDETDKIRQEYIDFGATTTPNRSNIVAPANPAFNVGNYSLIIDRGMNTALTNTQREFQTLTNPPPAPGTAPPAPGTPPPPPVPVPAITVFSGYRNPRRNVAAGSKYPISSRHVWGRALDLGVAGANATLWARLRQAGANAGYTSICEDGPTQKPCNDPTIDHVHIQW